MSDFAGNVSGVYRSGWDQRNHQTFASKNWYNSLECLIPDLYVQEQIHLQRMEELHHYQGLIEEMRSFVPIDLSFTTPIRNKPIRKKCLKFG